MHFLPIQYFFHKNMRVIKRKRNWLQGLINCSVSAKFFPMLVKKPYFGGVINPKTYLNHELGSKFFFHEWFGIKISEPIGFWKISEPGNV